MNELRVINSSTNPLPEYQTEHASGMDIMAFLQEPITIGRGKREIIPTGLFLEIPIGFEVQIRPRSGLAFKHGVTVLNSPGTIDADYRGEIKVLLINHGENDFIINNGERIAQMVLCKHEKVAWIQVEGLTETNRGLGGYGSTGL